LPRKNLNEWPAGGGPLTEAVNVKSGRQPTAGVVDRTGAKTILSSLSTRAISAILIHFNYACSRKFAPCGKK